MRILLGLLLVTIMPAAALADGRPMTVDDLLAVKSVSDPQVSPDGKNVVYVVSEVDREANRSNSSLWLVPITGGESRRLTTAPGTNNHPRWSPDGQSIAFVSDRGGSSQVWLLPISGGEARQLTHLPIDVSGPVWSPKGDKLAFTAEVYPGLSAEETAKKDKEKSEAKSHVRTFDHLMIRHWTSWNEGKVSHLFLCDASTGEAKDLIPDWKANVPPAPFGGSSDYAISPDGKEVAFTSEPLKDHPWSTNTDIWVVSTDGGEPKNLTETNPAADAQPAYSPDGKLLAYLSQSRAGFEADRWALTLRDRESDKTVEVAPGLDRPIQDFDFVARPKEFPLESPQLTYFIPVVVEDAGHQRLIAMALPDDPTSKLASHVELRQQLFSGSVTSVHAATFDAIIFVYSDVAHPGEIAMAEMGSTEIRVLTHHNDSLIEALDLAPAESFTFQGADGDDVQGFLVRPPGFSEDEKYPVLFLIHGGPQGATHDSWHARWNLALFAAPGYAIVAINPRGSTGFGQKFTDQISGDWAGRVYDDLMKGVDHALKTYPFLDGDRVAAAGGSYGGYMVNWIAGQTDRFRALISHAGVFDLHSMYFTTEELWFPEWEFRGPPWKNPDLYRELSPSHFVQNFQTPTLVIHGALDFRVPDAQGLGMFTALQRRGVPSRYVFFPDEGHWILKPANRIVWWNEVHGWLKTHLKRECE